MDILLGVQEILLYPFHLAKSRTAQRAYLSSILLGFGSLCLLALAILGYGIFYMNYVPQVGIEKIIHLQYAGAAGESLPMISDYPTGTAFLGDAIHSSQPYDISVSLHVPTSPHNYELGNFMIDMELWTQDQKSSRLITRSSRPAILTYQSPLAYTMKTLFKAPLLLLGLSKEAENVKLNIMDDIEFERDGGKQVTRKDSLQVANGIPGMVKVKVLAKKLQVYEVKVSFRAKLSGVKWLMYNHRIISFITFATTFWIMEMISAFLVWFFILNSLTKSWIPEQPKVKRYLREDELRGTISDLDLETEPEEEYTELEEEEGDEDIKGKRIEKTSVGAEGERTIVKRELGYASPALTPGPDTPGEFTGEESKNTTDYAGGEEEGEVGSDDTGEMIEREMVRVEAGMATDSGVGSSLSEGTAGVRASAGEGAASTGRSGWGGRIGSLQRRRSGGEKDED